MQLPHLFVILLIDFLFVGKCSYGVEERTPGKTYTKNGRWSQEKGSDFAGITTKISLLTATGTILTFSETTNPPLC